jgi:hypothetical protein
MVIRELELGIQKFVREESREWEYNGVQGVQQRVCEWELSELRVGDSYGKLVVEEELEGSLLRLSVWLEDLVTARLF